MAWYNEFEPKTAAWLQQLANENLIAPGVVDDRDIRTLTPNDIPDGQCHFFAGIGGWSYAFRLAGVPDDAPVWSASLPCQPFSQSGKRLGWADERHLFPVFFELVRERRPAIIFGEQVASKDGRSWFAGVRSSMETLGYQCGCADLCAASVGAPHIRQRLYWCAYSTGIHGKTFSGVVPSEVRATQVSNGGFPRLFNDGSWIINENRRGERLPSIVRNYNGLSRILAGFGNAIVPQVAATFIQCALEAIQELNAKAN